LDINKITKEYVGHLVDECGNVVDGSDIDTIIGNKQLCFLAYIFPLHQYETWLSW